ncbi:hypothetical protein [Tannockella kyphosi]|uniref:hypothetical protein n=1 Tax=Tannockella kyphosi TaxID=2899121 RepID=UPI00201170EE|nr:hypothetical protein [Tannockella kyphosi]
MKKKRSICLIIAIGACIILTLLFLKRENIYVQLGGLQYQFESMNYSLSQEKVDGEYSFDIDLEDLESNENKKIEIDDNCYIEIASIILESNGQYALHLQSHGEYDFNGGYFYTANEYYTGDQNNMITVIGELESDGESWYSSSYLAVSNKYGDSFSYSIDASKIDSNHVTVTLSNINKVILEREN